MDETLYDTLPCGLISTSNGLIQRVNKSLCRWVGYSAEELVQKMRLQDLLTVGCKIFHQTHWMPLLQMQGTVDEVQLELVHRDKRVIPVLVNAVRKIDVQGVAHDELVLIITTDRRKYERELLAARRRAEELLVNERAAQDALIKLSAEREQEARQRAVTAEQLIGIVSHDLRTPLHAVLLGANLLTVGNVTPAQTRTINRIVSSTTRASRLISDLLDFTQARLGGGLRVNPAPLDPHGVVAETVEELKLAWPGRLLEHRDRGGTECVADGDRIAQVVTNLVSNALTYGAADHPVTVTSEVAQTGLTVKVHNFGPVIPPALLPHIFEPLRRGDQKLAPSSRSVGLGLYIVRQIAVAHGGDVTVHSTPDEGTTFSLTAPAKHEGGALLGA